MSHELIQKRIVYSAFPTPVQAAPAAGGAVDLNATGDKYIITPAVPIDIYRFGFINQSGSTIDPDAGGLQLDLDFRPTAGSDTSRVLKSSLFRADAQTVANGKMVYHEVVIAVAQATGSDGSLVNVGPSGPLHVRPGEEAVLEVTNANGAAATAILFIEYADLGFAPVSTVSTADGVNITKDSTLT